MQVHSGKSATSRAGPGQCHCLIVRGVVGRMQYVFAVEAVVGPLMQTPHRKSKSTERHHFETVETENYSRIEYNSAENELSPTDNEITMNDDAQRWRTFTPEPFSGRWSVRKQKFKRLRHHIHVRCEVASEWIRLCDMRMWCDGVAFGTLQLYTCLQIDFLTRCESTSKGGCCSDCNFATSIRSIVTRLRNSNEFGFLFFFSSIGLHEADAKVYRKAKCSDTLRAFFWFFAGVFFAVLLSWSHGLQRSVQYAHESQKSKS